ncbi:hypothetical protein BD779DRAFT_1464520, partial [Infundibulicybe gibba]
NCLVAVRLKATRADMPSTHDIKAYIHNKFIQHLIDLKAIIKVKVSICTEKSALTNHQHTPMLTGCAWQGLNHCQWLDRGHDKGLVSQHDCTLDRCQ